MRGRRVAGATGALALVAAGTCALGVAGAAASAGKAVILGFTTAPRIGAVMPQVRSGGKVTTCLDSGDQREINVVFRVTGFPKSARVGVGLWGGNDGFQGTSEPQPTTAQIAKSAQPWSAASAGSGVAWGYSYGSTGYGPVNIDGVWQASIVVDGKVRATGRVTVACSA